MLLRSHLISGKHFCVSMHLYVGEGQKRLYSFSVKWSLILFISEVVLYDYQGEIPPDNTLSVSECLQCCIVAFKVWRSNLEALNVDLKDFFVQLYNLILEYRPDRDRGEILADALKTLLWEGKQHDMLREAAFIKRMATFALSFGSTEAIADLFVSQKWSWEMTNTTPMMDMKGIYQKMNIACTEIRVIMKCLRKFLECVQKRERQKSDKKQKKKGVLSSGLLIMYAQREVIIIGSKEIQLSPQSVNDTLGTPTGELTKAYMNLESPEAMNTSQDHVNFKQMCSTYTRTPDYRKALIHGRILFDGNDDEYNVSNSKTTSPVREMLHKIANKWRSWRKGHSKTHATV